MNRQPSIIFGEVLWDCFPDGKKVLGGAPFNVAWHLQAFGQAPLLISRVGSDSDGAEILQSMNDWGMTTKGVQIDPKLGTGVVTVTLKDGQPSYDIECPKAYDHIDSHLFPNFPEMPLLYHGSLAIRNEHSRQALASLKEIVQPIVFFDVNFRSPWWSSAIIQNCLTAATWLKLNDEELPALVPHVQDRNEQLKAVFEQKNLEYILLTEGAAGATLIHRDGDRLTIKPDKTTTVVDTVGAGDAFCSILLLGITSNWSLEQTLERAQTFASAVVGIQGATTTNKKFYQPFQDEWF